MHEAGGAETADDDEIAAAMLIGSFMLKEQGVIMLEAESAYGAAVLMPQLARTTGWPRFLSILTLRTYIFLFMNIGIQFCLLQLVAKEQDVMNVFAGQMYLCNFASGARGPGGTMTTPARTYSWDQWVTRMFVMDSLKRVFPDRAADIDANVDPGEYALESFGARWICCYVFVMATMNELFMILQMIQLLYMVPTKAERWMTVDQEDPDGEWLDRVEIQVAGIPLRWKCVYAVFILLPKMVLWKVCLSYGIDFLMDTSAIQDLIVNSVALAFILGIDEMICGTLMSDQTRQIMAKCKGYPLYDTTEEARIGTAEMVQRFSKSQALRQTRFRDVLSQLPWKLFATFAITLFMAAEYYHGRCTVVDGHFVSHPMRMPKSTRFGFLRTIFPAVFQGEYEQEPYWTMPAE